MKVYCDTSFFLRLIVPGSRRTEAQKASVEIEQELGFVPICSLCRFEVVQAIRFEVWRYRHDRRQGLPPDKAEHALNLFLGEIGTSFQSVPVSWETVFAQAELLTRSVPERGWRTIDLLHVAAANALGAVEFLSFDRQQNGIAAAQGFKTPLQALAA